jgi:hypothetical protein
VEYLREVDVYVDVAGRSDVGDAMEALAKSDPRAAKAVNARVDMLRRLTIRQALERKLIKQPTEFIYILRVQSGPVAFRLPFFAAPGGKLVILTHLASRSVLKGERYKALIQAAELRRQDWMRRNPKEGD